MGRFTRIMIIVLLVLFVISADSFSSDPITRTIHKYGLILDECLLHGKPLRKERKGDWGYFVTISHGIEFGSDIDSRWLRIEFQVFRKTKEVEFTVYSSTASRMGKWNEMVTFRRKIEKKDLDFKYSSTWPVICFENDDLKLKFRFFLTKAR